MSRSKPARFDRELFHLPDGLRWREWMMRVEAAIFASPRPVPREAKGEGRRDGDGCRLNALLEDINEELRGRPYEIIFSPAVFSFGRARATPRRCARLKRRKTRARPPSPSSKLLALSAIAYLQPITRGELSRLAGRDASRDVLGRLKSTGAIAPGPRAPEPGASIASVTTPRFLEVFGLGSLRDLPDLNTLEGSGGMERDVATRSG